MRRANGRIRLFGALLLFLGSAAAWIAGAPAAWGQTPITTKTCADGPEKLCRTIQTCANGICTTDYYYWT
jgi:hypothetical protein